MHDEKYSSEVKSKSFVILLPGLLSVTGIGITKPSNSLH